MAPFDASHSCGFFFFAFCQVRVAGDLELDTVLSYVCIHFGGFDLMPLLVLGGNGFPKL